MALLNFSRRQNDLDGDGDQEFGYDGSWGWYAVKWAVIAAIFVFFLVFVVGGYMHAKRRMKRGLPLLAYHRWLVPRTARSRYENRNNPQQNNYAYYNSYPMHPYGPPPPAYNPETDYVPPYSPPEGGSKVNPNQHISVQEHAPPPGPPPGRMPEADLGEGSGPRQPLRAASPFGK